MKNLVFVPGCRALAIASATIVVVAAASAQANIVEGMVNSLFGGDGITLDAVGHSGHFVASGVSQLAALGATIQNPAGRMPLGAMASSLTFDPDGEQDEFVSSTASLGPILGERAQTIGRGKIRFGLSYTRVDFSQLNGNDIDGLSLQFLHDDSCNASGGPGGDGFRGTPPGNPIGSPDGPCAFESDVIQTTVELSIAQDIFRLFLSYGVLENLDVSVTLPVFHTSFGVDAAASIVNDKAQHSDAASNAAHFFCSAPPCTFAAADVSGVGNTRVTTERVSDDARGIGDLQFRAKWSLLTEERTGIDVATVAGLTLPTGKDRDFHGSGNTVLNQFVILSKTIDRFTPYANLGYDVALGNHNRRDFSDFRYRVGTDVRLTERVSLATEFLGRVPFENGKNVHDFGMGVKATPWKTLVVSTQVSFPLNPDSGLRADAIWGFGGEFTF